jgi:hypothetical protein
MVTDALARDSPLRPDAELPGPLIVVRFSHVA